MFKIWTRKSWVTKCSDPTEVVEWRVGELVITEFQNIYMVSASGVEYHAPENPVVKLGTRLHRQLEARWQREREEYFDVRM